MLPLEGIRVLDFSRLAPGPFCTMVLADFGATVLLVEPPPEIAARSGRPDQSDRALAHDALRRNKRSIALNLREPEAREIVYTLARETDVVVEGFRPGVVNRLGIDYETLSKLNPGLIYCSISGYGQTGPYRDRVSHDINYISVAGALGMVGRPGTPPAIPMNWLADFAGGGMQAAFAILTAIIARERTGRGQYLDVALSDSVLYLLAATVSQYMADGDVPLPGRSRLNGGLPHYEVYETADGGWISLGSLEPHFFANLCRVMEREDFIPHQNNPEMFAEIRSHFAERFRTRSRDEWVSLLCDVDICAAPVYRLDEALSDAHNRERAMVVEVPDAAVGPVRQVGIGPKLSETPGSIRSLAPHPGEHTDAVLRELGYESGRIADLRRRAVVV
jgi:crotonobetainyl-CoA:carnitine CoA-transferase CaiB-like acyl-CoA transferase